MPNLAYGSISDPAPNLESLHRTVTELKQAVEILTRQRKPVEAGAITWQDLVDKNLITPDMIPPR